MKKLFTILLLLSVQVFVVSAQNISGNYSGYVKKNFQKAYASYQAGDNNAALTFLFSIVKRDSSVTEAYLLMSDIYHSRQEYDLETGTLQAAARKAATVPDKIWLNLGSAFLNNGQYLQAKSTLLKIKRDPAGDEKIYAKAQKLLQKTNFALKLQQDSFPISPRETAMIPDSVGESYFPRLTADDSTLIFTVKQGNASQQFQEDFFVCHLEKDGWTSPSLLDGAINTPFNEGAHSLSPDGKWLFFTACGREDGLGRCDIYFSQRTANEWSKPVNLGSPVNSKAWESQPHISSNLKHLYFTSNRKGGKGRMDIWRARMKGLDTNGVPQFSRPENLGDSINTPENEMSPFLHFDRKHFYFSSDGHPGMGGLDLFVSKMEGNRLLPPENMGYPLNTHFNEYGLFINSPGKQAWYTLQQKEKQSIYRYDIPFDQRPESTSYVKGTVKDRKQGTPLKSQVLLTHLSRKITDTISTSSNGTFLACLPVNESYAFHVHKAGYLFYSGHFDLNYTLTTNQAYHLSILLDKIETGKRLVLYNIFFDLDSAMLKPSSYPELELLRAFLATNSSLNIEIEGHTDNTGTREYNIELSMQRAKSVYSYLKAKGIEPLRMTCKGYGPDKPLNDNSTPQKQALNRRTEIRIIQ